MHFSPLDTGGKVQRFTGQPLRSADMTKPRQGRGIVRLSGAAGPAGSLSADLLGHRRDPERVFKSRELDRESGGSAGRQFLPADRREAA